MDDLWTSELWNFTLNRADRTEQTFSSTKEIKFIKIFGLVYSVSISVSGGKQLKYSGLGFFSESTNFQQMEL